MKKLFDVDVFGLKVPVSAKKDLLKDNTYGYCDFTKEPAQIFIEEKLDLEKFIHTLGHEIFHIVCDRLNIQIPEELEEQLCENFMIPLMDNFEIRLKPQLQEVLDAHLLLFAPKL